MALFFADFIYDKASLTLSSSSVAEYCLVTSLSTDCVNLNLTDFLFVEPDGPGNGSSAKPGDRGSLATPDNVLSVLFLFLFLKPSTCADVLYAFTTLFPSHLNAPTVLFTAVENHPFVVDGGVTGSVLTTLSATADPRTSSCICVNAV